MHYSAGDVTTPKDIEALAIELLNLTWTIDIYRFQDAKKINLLDLGWCFEFNDRKRAAGLCSKRSKTIYISKWLLEQNLDRALKFEDTIRHEIAHALDFEIRGTSNHDKVWKMIARQVLSNGERCYDSSEIGVVEITKYTLVCGNCDKKTPSHKAKKNNKKESACGECCKRYNFGRYSEKFTLVRVQNF